MPALPFHYDKQVYLPELDLWLDSTQTRDFAFVSHAHSDHTGRHRRVLLSAATRALYEHRLGRPRRERQTHALPFHQPLAFDDQEITLLPAGHVLGSAQLALRRADGRRLVYTGDLKLAVRPTAEPAEVPRCDFLVIESTFGQPRWRFPDLAAVTAELRRLIDGAVAQERTPVVLAYTLGKAQEATLLLCAAGYRVLAHPAVAAINRLYEAQGVALGAWEPLPLRAGSTTGDRRSPESAPGAPGIAPLANTRDDGAKPSAADAVLRDSADARAAVYLLPPPYRRGAPLPYLPPGARTFTILLTGWAVDPRTRYRYGVDAAVPLSDHADWPELVEYVARAQPSVVYTVHGFPDFAAHLREQGVEAYHLPDHQPTLFDGW